jgi:prepilin-type N-terminal cleavage/methylation domain-containing protein
MGRDASGFTLIEVIASIILVGIVATFFIINVANLVEGYLFTKDNVNTSLGAQVAMSRLMKELCSIDSVSSGSKTSMTYSFVKDGNSVSNRTVSWAGSTDDPLLLGGIVLAENVDDFQISYHQSHNDSGDYAWNGTEKTIGITLSVTGASDVVSSFSFRVAPRNL